MKHITRHIGTIIFIILVAAGLGIYLKYYYFAEPIDTTAEAPAMPLNMPAVPVQAEMIKTQSMRVWQVYSAHMTPVDIAEVRPQVSGTIETVLFEDGDFVKKDQVLFRIDNRTHKAAVAQAEADKLSATNTLDFAKTELKRTERLIKSNAISQQVYDQRQNDVRVAEARLKATEAVLERVKIDLDHTEVKAPISGRISRAEVTVGNLVETMMGAPLVTTIISEKGLYAEFDIDEQTYIDRVHPHVIANTTDKIPVNIKIGSAGKVIEGSIHSFDNQISSTSGTIRARAFFPNEDKALVSGMYVKVKLGSAEEENIILLPETAIGTNLNHKFVFVVSKEKLAEYRPVTLGQSIDGKRVITSGLNEDEMVITGGLMRLMPNLPVEVMQPGNPTPPAIEAE